MSTRDRTILGVVCLIVAVVAPWLLVISPKRAQATKLQNQIAAVQSQLSTIQTQLAQGERARAAFASSYTTMVRLGEAVPTDDNTPSLIYQLQSAAQQSHVDFQSLTFNAGQGGSSPTPSGSGATPTLPPGATVGPAGFPVEPFTFTFAGNFFHLANFVGRLQRFVTATNKKLSVSGRLMSLNGITLAPSSTGFPEITATIAATTYLLPASEGLVNGATPAGPASSSTQTVSNPSPSSSAPPAVVTPPVR
ncbi:MAG TPA: type II secretion system protein GspM [Solirubrobacteraceae bacterium]|nr:type II secretion system protein GspM [Solirubrobacteraceae bacterium]